MSDTPLPAGTYAIRHRVPGVSGLMAEGFTVNDANGTEVLHLKYRLHGPSMVWSVQTPDGAELARMEHPMVSMHPRFIIDRPGHPSITVRKANFMPVHETWRIEGGEGGDLDITGNLSSHEFTFTDAHGTAVASASRAYLSLHEGYAVRADGVDPLVAICAAVGLDVAENSHDH